MALKYIHELPQRTEMMIKMLPSFCESKPHSLEEFLSIKINNELSMKEYCFTIFQNIELIINRKNQEDKKELLKNEFAIQIAIILHGYEGIFPNDHAANQIVKTLC